jgi:quinol monooxygenase YgiN
VRLLFAALKEGIETAVRIEPGVQTLYAVYDKEHPTHVTVFEVYADSAAYHAHLETKPKP